MKNKNKFMVIVTCQGNPKTYFHKTLFGALLDYAKRYLKYNKYHTMNFVLRQYFGGSVGYDSK